MCLIDVSRYHFIASSTWSNDVGILNGAESIVGGTVSLGDETADVPEFDLYLESLQPGM